MRKKIGKSNFNHLLWVVDDFSARTGNDAGRQMDLVDATLIGRETCGSGEENSSRYGLELRVERLALLTFNKQK